MGSFLGFLIGSIVCCYVLYLMLDWAVFKRIVPDRFTGRILAGIGTYLASVLIYGIGAASDGAFRIERFAMFLIASLIVLGLAAKHGRDEFKEAERMGFGT